VQRNANKKGKSKLPSKEELKALVKSALIKGPKGTEARRRRYELLGLLGERSEEETGPTQLLEEEVN